MLPVLVICEPFHRLRIGELREDRIGHLAANTELWVRLNERNGWPQRMTTIFAGWGPANRQLMSMWKRKICIVEHKMFKLVYSAFEPVLKRTRFHVTLPEMPVIEHEAFLNCPPALSFTDDERRRGFDELESWGVGRDEWFVCFHARDPAYLAERAGFGVTTNQSTYFDCSIENFIPAMEWVVKQGGVAIRVGHLVQNPLPDLGDRVIDYASHHRSDFMDIFLPAHCRYFVGNTSGLFCIARIFNVPILYTNHCPYPWAGTRHKRNMDIPKLLRRHADGKILSVAEIRDLNLLECHRDEPKRLVKIFKEQTYEELGFEWIENSSDEILDGCMDIQEMIDGVSSSMEAQRLQEIFNDYYVLAPPSPHKGRISPRFALRHRDLIEPRPVTGNENLAPNNWS